MKVEAVFYDEKNNVVDTQSGFLSGDLSNDTKRLFKTSGDCSTEGEKFSYSRDEISVVDFSWKQ